MNSYFKYYYMRDNKKINLFFAFFRTFPSCRGNGAFEQGGHFPLGTSRRVLHGLGCAIAIRI